MSLATFLDQEAEKSDSATKAGATIFPVVMSASKARQIAEELRAKDKEIEYQRGERETAQAEIERLTDALATAEAERDAAYAVAKVLVKSEGSINVGGTKIAMTGVGYLVSNLSGAGTYEEHQFDAAWQSFCANALRRRAPLPAAAPAVDDEPVGDDDDEPYDVTGAVEYARGHVADALVSASNGNYERAFGHLNAALTAAFNSIEALITKGETR
jgi:hypothetical protein